MRPRPSLIAPTLLISLAIGCTREPLYNSLAAIPPGGDPPIRRPATTSRGKARAPKPPITKTLRKIAAVGGRGRECRSPM